jgi:hypothetical protein
MLNGKWGYIDTKGNEVVPCKYDDIGEFSEGLAAVKEGDKWRYVDKTGKTILKLDKKYQTVNEFSEGLAHVGYDFIDKTGKVVISLTDKDGSFIYHGARAFHNGRAAVTTSIVHKGEWGFIDSTGTEVIPCKYAKVTDFADGRALVEKAERSRDQYGNSSAYTNKTIIDRDGNAVVKVNMYNLGEFSPEGWALHKSFTLTARIDQVYFVNADGKVLYSDDNEYSDANSFSEGLASVQVFNKEAVGRLGIGESRWGFIDKTGKMVIPPVYYDAGEFHEGLAAVQEVEIYKEWNEYPGFYETDTRGGKWGFIDKSGKTVIPFRYETTTIDSRPAVNVFEYFHTDYSYFMDGIALVKRDEKYGFIDKSGNEVIPCKYKSATVFVNGFAKVGNENKKMGIIDKTGREVLPCQFERDEIQQFSNGFCAVRRNGKWGFVDTTGNEVIPCKYELAGDFKQ